MPETRPPYDDEIDLLEIFQTLWNGKWIILATVLILLLGIFGYVSFQKIDFKATTEIKPISSDNVDSYNAFNSQIYKEEKSTFAGTEKYLDLSFLTIDADKLLTFYIEQLNKRTVFEEAIVKYELLDPKNFDDEQTFNEEVVKFASEIEILPPINEDVKKKGGVRMNWLIEAEYYDENKWKQLLSYVASSTNQNVRNILQKSFENSLALAKQKQAFHIEDINTNIENALSDYDRTTSDRVYYLNEQAAIARKLGIARNTLEAQTFDGQNSMIANVKTEETPYYLRGYDAIEKEIELIKIRQDKKAFMPDLIKLEQEKRNLKQDTIRYERVETSFNNTPIMKGDDFLAASIKVGSTEFKPKTRMIVMFSLGAVLGGIIASIYLLISNAMRRRKNNSVKA